MYALRALAVSLSVFVFVYALVFAMVRCGWPAIRRRLRDATNPGMVNVLLAMQVAPMVIACVVVASFTVPSFLRFEPRVSDEGLSVVVIAMSLFGLALLIAGAARTIVSIRRSTRLAREWSRQSGPADVGTQIPALQPKTGGLLAITGLARQTLFISGDIASALTFAELKRAVAHEMVHVERRDNLAKLLVTFCRVPGLRSLERAWLEAMEMAADQRAVKSKAEALELASALVKVSRLRVQRLPELATGFAAIAAGPLSARVERLLAWEETQTPPPSGTRMAVASSVLVTLAASTLTYHSILLQVHTFTEWLVR